ncbi:MAG TPA: cellulose binding domain-containing protein [Candidatus Goldiibacteriota bacterium]|nr:cellulose binding domain-containing protein [Candidatus Goldiibacteriota bacterium]
MQDMFTEEIEWEELKKGDILIKSSHVAIVSDSPKEEKINVIESAKRWIPEPDYVSRVVSNTYTKETNGKIVRDHEPYSTTSYKAHRFYPPYVKQVSIYQEVIVDGRIEKYELFYRRVWSEKDDQTGLELKKNISSGIGFTGKLIFEIQFSKAMALKTEKSDYIWQDIDVKIGNTLDAAKQITAVHEGNQKLRILSNNGIALYHGWGTKSDIDNGSVFTKWIGEIVIDDNDEKNLRENILYINARSLAQDKLDVNPSSLPKRKSDGAWSDYTPGTDTNHKISILPEGSVLYMSGQRPTPVGTATPLPYMYDKVVVKNFKQTPTEEPTLLPESMTPIPTPTNVVPATEEIFIGDYIKGVLYGLVGEADFSNSKYENGFKALAIAAYTQLLHEIEVNKAAGNSYDIMVNGYAGKQSYFIPFKKFSGISGTKSLIDKVVDELVKPVNVDGNNYYYIKAFWFNCILTGKDKFIKTREFDGAKIPFVLTNVFSFAEGRNAKNIIIQSGLNTIGTAKTYLRETKCDEADVAVPAGLLSGSKCGMSAWAAMLLSFQGENEKMILDTFYHWAPVLLNKVEIIQGGKTKYFVRWGKAKIGSEGKILRERLISKFEQAENTSATNGIAGNAPETDSKGVVNSSDAIVKLYFTDELLLQTATVKKKEKGAKSLPVIVVPKPADDGHAYLLQGTLSKMYLDTLLGNEKNTIQTILAVHVTDAYNGVPNDQLPESVSTKEGEKEMFGYEYSVLGSDETNVFSLIYESMVSEADNGTAYKNKEVEVVQTGEEVSVNLPNFDLGVDLDIQGIDMNIPRPDLKGARWGFDGSLFGVVLLPDVGQGIKNGWAFAAGALQTKLGSIDNPFRGIKGPQIIIPQIDTGVDISGIAGQLAGIDPPCDMVGSLFDDIQNNLRVNADKPNAYGGNTKVSGHGMGANALLDYMSNTANANSMSSIASISLVGAQLGGVDMDAVNMIMQAQDVANKASIGIALVSAVQMAIGNPVYAAYLANGAMGYARSWGESAVKALAFSAVENFLTSNGQLIEGAEEFIKGLPGGSNFPGFGDSLNPATVYKQVYGCDAAEMPFENFDISKVDWWEVASKVAEFTESYKSKEDVGEDSSWLKDVANRTADVEKALANIDKVKITGVAGKKGANLTVKSASLTVISEVLNILKNIPEPIVNSITSIGPIVISVLNSTEGNLIGTLDSQLGISTGIVKDLEAKGKAAFSEIDLSGLPKLPVDLPINFDMVPFMGEVFTEVLNSLSFGKGAQSDPARVLSEIDEPGEVGVFYPYLSTAEKPEESYNGWIVGVTTNKAFVHVEGWASDYLPQFLQIYAQADNGPIVTTVLKLDTTLVTTEDGKRGKADWALDVPLPHAGKNTIKVWTVNAGGHRVETSFISYLVGTSFPQEGSRAVPVSSFIWRAYDNGLFGAGDKVVSQGGGILNFIGVDPGKEPMSDIFTATAAAGKTLKIFYPDDTTNPDLMLADEDGNTYTANVKDGRVPDSGRFRFKLKSIYTGKSFITVMGGADALKFKEWRLEYCGSHYNLTTSQGFSWDTCFTNNGITMSNSPVQGPLFQIMTAWDVWSNRLYGPYRIRTVITDDNLNYDRKELDNALFTIGTPIDISNTAATIVADPYYKFQLLVPEGAVKQTEYVNVYSENTEPKLPLMNNLYQMFTPKYGLFPALDESRINAGSELVITIKYTDSDLDIPNFDAIFGLNPNDADYASQKEKARDIIEENLGIYREADTVRYGNGSYVTKTARELLAGTQHPIGTYTVMTRVANAAGKYFVLPADKAPILRTPPYASPFIFNPEEESKGRTTTAIYFKPMAATSKYVYANVDIKTFKGGRVVRNLYNGIDKKEAIELKYAGKYGDIDEYRGNKYWFYNFAESAEDTASYRRILDAPIDGITWDGIGQREDGSTGYVEDGVYKAYITVMDVFGNSTTGTCMIVKGRIVPSITQIAGKAAQDGLGLNAVDDGENVLIAGTATGGEVYKGYMVGYRAAGFVSEDTDAEITEGFTMIDLPLLSAGTAVTKTAMNRQIIDGELAKWDITSVYNGEYDLGLFILSEDMDGKVKVMDKFIVNGVKIENPQGIYNLKGTPNPFSGGVTLTANVNLESPGDVMFTITDETGNVVESLYGEPGEGVKYNAYWPADGAADGYYGVTVTAADRYAEGKIRKVAVDMAQAEITAPDAGATLTEEFDVKGSAFVADSEGQTIPVKLAYYELLMKQDGGEWESIRKSDTPVKNGVFKTFKAAELQCDTVSFKVSAKDNAGNTVESSVRTVNIGFAAKFEAVPGIVINNGTDSTDISFSFNKDVTYGSLKIVKGSPDALKNFDLKDSKKAGKDYVFKWDGKGNSGNALTDGEYSAKLHLEKDGITVADKNLPVILAAPVTYTAKIEVNAVPRPYFDFKAAGHGKYDVPVPFGVTITGYATEQFLDEVQAELDDMNITAEGGSTNHNRKYLTIPYDQDVKYEASSNGCDSGDHSWYIDIKGVTKISGDWGTGVTSLRLLRGQNIEFYTWASGCGLFTSANTDINFWYREMKGDNELHENIKSVYSKGTAYLHRRLSTPFNILFNADHFSDWNEKPEHGVIIVPTYNPLDPEFSNSFNSKLPKPDFGFSLLKGTITGWGANLVPLGECYKDESGDDSEQKNMGYQNGTLTVDMADQWKYKVKCSLDETFEAKTDTLFADVIEKDDDSVNEYEFTAPYDGQVLIKTKIDGNDTEPYNVLDYKFYVYVGYWQEYSNYNSLSADTRYKITYKSKKQDADVNVNFHLGPADDSSNDYAVKGFFLSELLAPGESQEIPINVPEDNYINDGGEVEGEYIRATIGIINYPGSYTGDVVRLYDKDNVLVAETNSFQTNLILEKNKMPYKMSAVAQSRPIECALVYEGRTVYNNYIVKADYNVNYIYTPEDDIWVKSDNVNNFNADDGSSIKIIKDGYYGSSRWVLLQKNKTYTIKAGINGPMLPYNYTVTHKITEFEEKDFTPDFTGNTLTEPGSHVFANYHGGSINGIDVQAESSDILTASVYGVERVSDGEIKYTLTLKTVQLIKEWDSGLNKQLNIGGNTVIYSHGQDVSSQKINIFQKNSDNNPFGLSLFPSAQEYASVTTTAGGDIKPGPDKVPHSSVWTVKGPYYPDTDVLHEDIVLKKEIDGNAAGDTGLTFGDAESFGTGMTYDEYEIDKVNAVLRDPSYEPYESKTYIKVTGDINTTTAKYYTIAYKKRNDSDSWHLSYENLTPRAGVLGYIPVKDKIGAYDVLLTVINKDNSAYKAQTGGEVGHVITPNGGFAADAYEQVFLSFPKDSLRKDKTITITPLKREDVPALESGAVPAALIYDFKAADRGVAEAGRLRQDDFKMDAKNNIPKPAILTMLYDKRQLGDFPESSLSVYKLHLTDSGVEELKLVSSMIDIDAKVITAEMTSFSTVQLIPNANPPLFEVSAMPNPAGLGSVVSIYARPSKPLNGALNGWVNLPFINPAPAPVWLTFTAQEKEYMNGTANVFVEALSPTTTAGMLEDGYKLILGVVGKDGLPNDGVINNDLILNKSIKLSNVIENGQVIYDKGYKINRAGVYTDYTETPPVSKMWITVVDTAGNTYNEKEIYSFATKDTTWSYDVLNGKRIMNISVSDTKRNLVLQTTTPGEQLTFPPVNWWNGKTIDMAGQKYKLSNVQIRGSQATGTTITAELLQNGVPVTITDSMKSLSWTMYAPVNEYRASFDVDEHVPGTVSGTAEVLVKGIDYLGNTGEGKGYFVIDKVSPPVTVETDKILAGYGDTITVKAKSKINGVMPVIKIYKKNPATEEVPVDTAKISEITLPGTVLKTGEILYPLTALPPDFNNYSGDVEVKAEITVNNNLYFDTKTVKIDTIKPVFTLSVDGTEPKGAGYFDLVIDVSEELREAPEVIINTGVHQEKIKADMVYSTRYLAKIEIKDEYALNHFTNYYSYQTLGINVSGYDVAGNSGTAQKNITFDVLPPQKVENLTGTRIITGGQYQLPANCLDWEMYQDPTLAGFVIYRDDIYLETAGPLLRSYTDVLAGPNFDYQPLGGHTYYVAAVDLAGNTGAGAYVTINDEDGVPVTVIEALGNSYCVNYDSPNPLYIGKNVLLGLNAYDTAGSFDDVTGVKNTYYSIAANNVNTLYSQPFVLNAANTVTAVYYYSVDRNANTETVKSTNIYKDTKAPAILIEPVAPFYTGNSLYTGNIAYENITSLTREQLKATITAKANTISLEMIDVLSDEELRTLLLSVDNNLSGGSDGIDTMDKPRLISAITNTSKDYNADELLNVSEVDLKSIFRAIVNKDFGLNVYYLSPAYKAISISASDAAGQMCGAGIKSLSYRFDAGEEQTIITSGGCDYAVLPDISGLTEGMHSIEAVAKDMVGNSGIYSGAGDGFMFFIIDPFAPSTNAYVCAGECVTVTADNAALTVTAVSVTVELKAFDNDKMPSGVGNTYYILDSAEPRIYLTPITLVNAESVLSYYSVDRVGNTENYKTLSVYRIEPTQTATPSVTMTQTATPSVTPTVTASETETVTETATPSVTGTSTPSVTESATETITDTCTQTATETVTPSVTPSATPSVTETVTGTATETVTETATDTPTETCTETVTETATDTVTKTVTETATQSVTETVTETATGTATPSSTGTDTKTATQTATETATGTSTATPSSTVSDTVTKTCTETVTKTVTETATGSVTETATESVTATVTETATKTVTATVTTTVTRTVTKTITNTNTPTATVTVTSTNTITPTVTQTSTPLANLRCEYFSYNTSVQSDTIFVNIRIYNTGNTAINIIGISAKYWFTQEGIDPSTAEVDDSRILPSGKDIKAGTTADVSVLNCSQDRVLTAGFGVDILQPGEFIEVHLRVHHTSWQSYNKYTQTNDYSFGTQAWFAQWNKIGVYCNNSLVWGIEPDCSQPVPTPTIGFAMFEKLKKVLNYLQ